MKLVTHLNEYIKDYSKEHAFSSTQKLTSLINLHLSSLLNEDLPIDVAKLKRWKYALMSKGFSYSFNNSVYWSLNNILNYYSIYYHINNNLYLVKKFRNVKDVKKIVNYITLEELNKIVVDGCNRYYDLFYILAFYSGLRVGELLALKIDNFTYLKNGVYINFKRRKGRVNKTKCGDSSCGFVSLPDWLYNRCLALCPKRGYLFKFSESTIDRDLKKRLKSKNMKPIALKDFRHSCACFLINNGFTLYEVKKHLRHASIKTTEKYYADVYQSVLNDKINNLQRL